MKSSYLLKKFLPYYKNYWHIMVFDLICASITAICEVIFPLLVRFITDAAITDVSLLTPESILKIGGFYILLRLLDVAAYFYMANQGHVMGTKMETEMRKDLFSHLQKQTFSFFSTNKIGQLMSRITTDLFDITEFAHHFPEELFIAAIKIIVSFIILCSFNVYLTLIIFLLLPLMLICCKSLRTKMRATFKKNREQTGIINSKVEDSLLGIRVVKSFTNEDVELEKFEEGNQEYLRLKKLSYKYMGAFQCVTRFFDGLMYITGIIFGAFFLMHGKISPGDFAAYLLYISTLIASIRRIIEFTEQFQRGMTGIERFCEIMDTPVAITDAPDAVELKDVKGEISFEDVDFCYEDGNENVLTKINIEIKQTPKPTQVVAGSNNSISSASTDKIVGRNDECPCGSGKKYKNCCGKK